MEKNTKPDKFASFSYRVSHSTQIRLLFFIFFAQFLMLMAVIIASENYYLLLLLLFFVPIDFLIFTISKKNAQCYLSSFSADSEKLILSFYEKDELMTAKIRWQDVDFCFGRTKQGGYLVVWDRDKMVLKIEQRLADHKSKMENLEIDFCKYIPREKIKASNSIFSMIKLHTKKYSLGLFGQN